MTAAWSGFLGVIVGGLITTFWSWFAVVHQEIGNAMVSARLVDEDLAKLADASRLTGRPMIDVSIWNENRRSLARVLGKHQWVAVSIVYRRSTVATVADDHFYDEISQAQNALQPLVDGKRSALSWLTITAWRTAPRISAP